MKEIIDFIDKWQDIIYKGIGLQTGGWCVRGCIL